MKRMTGARTRCTSGTALEMVLPYSFLVLLCLHVLRNLTPFYMVAVGCLAVFMALFYPLRGSNILVRNIGIYYGYVLFMAYTVWVCLWSFVYNPDLSALDVAGRLFFTTSLVVLLAPAHLRDVHYEQALRLFVYCVCIGAASYFLQVVIGPITWFNDDPMERGLVLRYSTTLGSGNIYGIVVGIALYLAARLDFGRIRKYFLVGLMLSGAIMSMQKASLLNVSLFVLFLQISMPAGVRLYLAVSILLFISGLVLLAYVYQDTLLAIYLQEYIYNSIGINVFDNPALVKSTVLDAENVVERFLGLHLEEIFEAHNAVVMFLVGIGATGAGGGMGVDDAPQAHSGFWDLYFMGGIGYLLSFLLLFTVTCTALWKIKTDIARLLLVSNVIFFVNIFAATIPMFHPIIAYCFWLSVLYAMQYSGFRGIVKGRCWQPLGR